VKKIIFLLFACFFISDFVSASAICHHDCKLGDSPCKTTGDLEGIKPVDRICPPSLVGDSGTNKGFENTAIGWGKNCAIPAGEQSVNGTSCISVGNVIGQIMDTVTTVGVGILMRQNFCSFDPAGHDLLEGSIINNSFLEECKNVEDHRRDNCISCLLNGKKFNTDTGKGCIDPTQGGENLNVNAHLSAHSDLCNGIPNLEKPLLENGKQVYIDDNGNKVSQELNDNSGIPVYCPITRCNIPTKDIRVKYNDPIAGRTAVIAAFSAVAAAITGPIGPLVLIGTSLAEGACCDIKSLKPGDTKRAGFLTIISLHSDRTLSGDKVCAQMDFGIDGYTTLACKPAIPPEISLPEETCFMKKSAHNDSKSSHSNWIFPITSRIVQITNDVFNSMFGGGMTDCQNGLTTFQDNMKNIVRVLLVLYVIFFGFRVATGKGGDINKKVLFTFILKFTLVVYFSVGPLYTATTTDEHHNGLVLLRNVAVKGMNSLSNMIVEAGVKDDKGGLCDFAGTPYDKDYSYLKMWDTLDCKLFFYLGFGSPTKTGLAMIDNGTGHINLTKGIFNLLWGLLFSGNLLFMIFLFAFGFFLLSFVVHFTHLYIIAMVAITIMIFFGPIFVPLALFDYTKSFFDRWLSLLLGYALQPVITVAVISFMILTFDNIVYSGCHFTKQDTSYGNPYWTINTSDDDFTDYCEGSFGFNLGALSVGKFLQNEAASGDGDGTLFEYGVATKNLNSTTLLEGLMLCTFFAFLFYYFADQIGALAQELSGAPSLGAQAISANAMTDAALNVATKGKYEEAKQATKKGGGKGGAPSVSARAGIENKGDPTVSVKNGGGSGSNGAPTVSVKQKR